MSSDVPVSDEPSKRLCVAKIATAHGVKGLVKLHIFADNIDLLKGTLFTSESDDETLSLTLKNATAKHWIAEVNGVTDRNAAESLRGTEIYIDQNTLPEPGEGEFYIKDLIGLNVVDKEGKAIGNVIAVENFGAGDLLDIQPPGAESFYLPFNDENVMKIKGSIITVKIPEGLIE